LSETVPLYSALIRPCSFGDPEITHERTLDESLRAIDMPADPICFQSAKSLKSHLLVRCSLRYDRSIALNVSRPLLDRRWRIFAPMLAFA